METPDELLERSKSLNDNTAPERVRRPVKLFRIGQSAAKLRCRKVEKVHRLGKTYGIYYGLAHSVRLLIYKDDDIVRLTLKEVR